mgnify:CR=1 FL=1
MITHFSTRMLTRSLTLAGLCLMLGGRAAWRWAWPW